MLSPRRAVIACMILAAAASRLLPHPPNVAPITALALFAGAHFQRKWLAFLVPLAAILLSDLVLGLQPLVPVVYGSFALITCIGFWLRRQRTTARIVTASLVGGLLSSTLLDQIVTPALFYKFGRKIYEHRFDAKTAEEGGAEVDELGLPVRRPKPGSETA